MGDITMIAVHYGSDLHMVSKLFRAYRLYNDILVTRTKGHTVFQSSFELTGYITKGLHKALESEEEFQSSFELTGYITLVVMPFNVDFDGFQSSFELTGYITNGNKPVKMYGSLRFQSSFELTDYITTQKKGIYNPMILFRNSFEFMHYVTV